MTIYDEKGEIESDLSQGRVAAVSLCFVTGLISHRDVDVNTHLTLLMMLRERE